MELVGRSAPLAGSPWRVCPGSRCDASLPKMADVTRRQLRAERERRAWSRRAGRPRHQPCSGNEDADALRSTESVVPGYGSQGKLWPTAHKSAVDRCSGVGTAAVLDAQFIMKSILLLLASLASLALADSTCAVISATTDIHVEYPQTPDYDYDQTQYWSTGCSALPPSCILSPISADEVAAIISVLHTNQDKFAVKSGGHNPNRGFSSIDGGPLISTRNLSEVTYDAASATVRVGPGNRWGDVQAVLDDLHVTVLGGRIGDVGVGGYMVGGGLSFLSSQYGWAANNVVEYEVVLANATIVQASASSNPDLFKALKGGGNNYGVVTTYIVRAHPVGEVWGGNLFFTGDKAPQLLAAARDFTEHSPDDKAAILMSANLVSTGNATEEFWNLFVFYHGPSPPAGVFDNFTSLDNFNNTLHTRSYADLLAENDWTAPHGWVFAMSTETTSLPDASVGAEVLTSYYDFWKDTTQSLLSVPGLVGSIDFQPIPKVIAHKARKLGGDMLDLDTDVDRIMMALVYKYASTADDAAVDAASQRLVGGLRDRVLAFTEAQKLPEAYLPLFMNDAYFRQDYFGRLRTAECAKSAQQQYDPEGLFATRTGGFKPA